MANLKPTEAHIRNLVLSVANGDVIKPSTEWILVVHEAKGRGYIREDNRLRLSLTSLGKQWLQLEASERKLTMQKLTPEANYRLGSLSFASGVPMQELIGHIIDAVYDNRERLNRFGFAHGARADCPWEAIPLLLEAVE